jgi:predicted porin
MAKEHLKPTLLSSAVAAGLAATTMPAHALTLGISGQINKTIGYIDNGDNSAIGFFDNNISGSRFRFTGEEDIGGGLKVGGVWEWQWSNSPAGKASFNSNGKFNETSAGLQDRKTELYFAGKWGKVSLGKGDGAANGSAEVDLSGTTTMDYAGGNACLLGSMTYGSSSVTVGSTYTEYDGESRNDRIRYDTPKFAKVLSIAVSLANANEKEAAVRYAQTLGSTKIAAALGYTDNKDATTSNAVTAPSTDRKRASLSASAILKNGLNFTISYSSQENNISSTSNTNSYFKIGWKKGKNAVSLSYGQQDIEGTDANPSSIAVAYNYSIAKDVEAYASIRSSSADDFGGSSLDDVTGFWVGSRIKWK